jgi:hypothetical protein
MKLCIRRLGIFLVTCGIDPRKLLWSLVYSLSYVRDLIIWLSLSRRHSDNRFMLRLLPVLSDKRASGGVASGQYFHQDLWAARKIFNDAPNRHVDVGSRVDGFVAHLLVFRAVEVCDVRPIISKVEGLKFTQVDLMRTPLNNVAPAPSVSCLHALEHFGLGRYGDPIAPEGWESGLANLSALVAPGGKLYLSVPIGKPTIEFNAQRVFDARMIPDAASKYGLVLKAFAYVDDVGDLYDESIPLSDVLLEQLSSLSCGCGLYVFTKRSACLAVGHHS